ncbi:MAG: hypothetical protein E7663_07640 [Ruminococcaceae bacterium]|nr:hypothetical protein [Oscillospiraceae bacterium]
MGIVGIAGVALFSAMLILLLRELRGGVAPPVRLAATLVLFGMALSLYAPLVGRIEALFSLSGAGEYAAVILRATGIALICELTASICRDLGEGGVAEGVLLFGRLEILLLALPFLDELLKIAEELLK